MEPSERGPEVLSLQINNIGNQSPAAASTGAATATAEAAVTAKAAAANMPDVKHHCMYM